MTDRPTGLILTGIRCNGLKGGSAVRKFAEEFSAKCENCGKLRFLHPTKQGVWNISEIQPPIFCRPLKCRMHCRPPSALHSPRSDSAIWGFRALWPMITPAKLLNQPSPRRTLMELPRTTKQWKNKIADNFCKNPFAKYPLFQLLNQSYVSLLPVGSLLHAGQIWKT